MVDKKVLFSLIVLFSLFAIASLFVYMKPEITGFASFEPITDYTNEADCLANNYTWVNETELQCPTDLVNVTIGGNCANITYSNEADCLANNYTWVNETELQCPTDLVNVTIDGTCFGEVIEPADVCDSEHLDLCNETECNNLNYSWYGSVCNLEEQCISDCSGKECGDDGCGGSCGDCGSDYECEGGVCVEEEEDEENETDETEEIETTSESDSIFTGATVETKEEICSPDWNCTEWSGCINGTQDRTCEDVNNCGSEEGKPEILQSCVLPETCFDGMKNQDETGIDCGGVCEKRCSIFTIVGSVINIPVQTGKQFFAKNKIKSFIAVGILVLITGGLVTVRVLRKKKLLSKILPKKLLPEKN